MPITTLADLKHPKYRVFASNNDYAQTFRDVTNRTTGAHDSRKVYGICCAATALWCGHMLEGKKDYQTEPDINRAQALKVAYNWAFFDPLDSEAPDKNLLEKLRLVPDNRFIKADRPNMTSSILANPGCYYLFDENHVVGANVAGSKIWFYDVEAGLFTFTREDDWTAALGVLGYEATHKWTGYRVTKKP